MADPAPLSCKTRGGGGGVVAYKERARPPPRGVQGPQMSCRAELLGLWGNVCPERYFSINYPDFSPIFTLSWRSPPSRPRCTAHLRYNAHCIIKQCLCIQQPQLSSIVYLTNNIAPTGVGVSTFSAIVLLTLITSCDGGALLATQHTHFCLILCLILRATTEQIATRFVPYTTVHVIVTLLAGLQSAIISSN